MGERLIGQMCCATHLTNVVYVMPPLCTNVFSTCLQQAALHTPVRHPRAFNGAAAACTTAFRLKREDRWTCCRWRRLGALQCQLISASMSSISATRGSSTRQILTEITFIRLPSAEANRGKVAHSSACRFARPRAPTLTRQLG